MVLSPIEMLMHVTIDNRSSADAAHLGVVARQQIMQEIAIGSLEPPINRYPEPNFLTGEDFFGQRARKGYAQDSLASRDDRLKTDRESGPPRGRARRPKMAYAPR